MYLDVCSDALSIWNYNIYSAKNLTLGYVVKLTGRRDLSIQTSGLTAFIKKQGVIALLGWYHESSSIETTTSWGQWSFYIWDHAVWEQLDSVQDLLWLCPCEDP